MNTLHLSKVYHKVEAILKQQNLWPEGENVSTVDYSICQEIVLVERPRSYILDYKVDFGGTKGIYIDFTLLLVDTKGAKREVDFGTIKSLVANRETLAAYTSLATNFVSLARQELDKALANSFPIYEMFYEIYSMNTESTFHPSSLQVSEIMADMDSYATCYRKIASASFLLREGLSDKQLCTYIAQRSFIEMNYAIEISDLIVLTVRYGNDAVRKSYIVKNNNVFDISLEAVSFS